MNATQYMVMEVKDQTNQVFLNEKILQKWYRKTDELDEYCCNHRNEVIPAAAKLVLDSYNTIRMMRRCIEDISLKKLPAYRLYCSYDSRLTDIQAILILSLKDNKCEIEFAVTNPANLEVLPYQKKHMTGAVAVIGMHIFKQVTDEFPDVHAQAQDSALQLAERIGFEKSDREPVASYLTPIKISNEKISSVLKDFPFTFEEVTEFSLTSRFSS
jgi:hypothetical protein